MLKLKNEEITSFIPEIKEGDFLTASIIMVNDIVENHILYVYKEQPHHSLSIVSLTHITSVWLGVSSWWNTEKNNFFDINILEKGTEFKLG